MINKFTGSFAPTSKEINRVNATGPYGAKYLITETSVCILYANWISVWCVAGAAEKAVSDWNSKFVSFRLLALVS